ncbi:MAG TPA: SMC family ATPase [Rubricoccaceae bacterium]
MVPVRLQLRNFLSYGESAPALDFDAFHVACLSGGNGQGKSALLDAITWALWGEARKSSDSRKPDEQLMRVGAREMEVDFEFTLGGAGHRIVRRYTQTASGKTSKPGLEFQASDGSGGYVALTAESVRATQAAIDARLGIDYETFVNSTFLLQGRSDEFTRKKPGDRKLILARILGLDRYDRLATAAGTRYSALRERFAKLDAEAERLVAATEHVPAWQAERDALARDIDASEAAISALDSALGASAQAIAALDTAASDDARLADAHAQATARRADVRTESARLDERIAEADALVAQAERIEADHAHYEVVRARRTVLDEAATLHAALTARAAALRLDVQKALADAETRLARLAADVDNLRERVREDALIVAGRDRAARAVAASDAAVVERAALERVRVIRETAQRTIDGIDHRLASDRGALRGEQAGLRTQIEALRAATAPAASSEADALERQVADAEAAARALDDVTERGTTLAQTVAGLDATLARLDADAAALRERQARIGQTRDETCPTCGTELNDDHRAHVADAISRDLGVIAETATRLTAERDAATSARNALRADFARLRATVDAGRAASEALATAREREARRADDAARLAEAEAAFARVTADLEGEQFGASLRAQRSEAERTIDAHPFDTDHYDAVTRDAGLRDHHARALREIDVAAERMAERIAEGRRKKTDLEARRAALDAGEPAREARDALTAVEVQAAASGYDAAEHERVSAEMTRLADAPARLARLLDVRRSIAEWAERRATLAAEALALDAEMARLSALRDALSERLAARVGVEAERTRLSAERDAATRTLADAHARRGGLDARLEQAAADRASLAATRADLADARREQKLYGTLRRAFGRHGIPSLIIEETLPEVEERANVLLDRLTGGTTRVSLETLKDNKTGGTRETLDITITDAQGAPRAYEMYSGGEAFRVNFALRIALSQLLADRAGTQIRTLVIDEGFGTQDADGLHALIAAIRTIQDDFDKILVVTHLEELKNAFPVRIEVRKDPVSGSTFDLIGI